jgi:hypothetical protein
MPGSENPRSSLFSGFSDIFHREKARIEKAGIVVETGFFSC